MSGETVADRRVHPGTIALRLIKEAPSTLVALPAGITLATQGEITRWLIIAAVAGVIFLFFNWLAWSRFRYGVGEREIVIESGILSRTRRSIPFDRIQDIDIERPLLARLFGLAKVRIETGGAGKDEGLLDSVTLAEADRLRATVRASKTGRVSALAPLRAVRTLFEMHVPRVLLFGLFNFSLAFIAGIFAFLQTFDDFLPFDIYDPARWIGLVERSLPQRFSAGAIGAVLILAALLGVAAGVARTLMRNYGFRLTAEEGRFRRERGLFTRTEVVLSKRRIQLALIETGPVRRLFGWFGLAFQTLGSGSDGSGRQTAAPFARRDEFEPILEEAGRLGAVPPSEMKPVSSRHVVRSLASASLPFLGILIVSWWQPTALFFLGLLPFVAAAAVLERRRHRYAIVGDKLFVMRGLWQQLYWIVPLRSVQAVSLSRSVLQRRLGLATVSVDTAGAPMLQPVRIRDIRADPARRLATEISAYCSGRKSGTDK